MVNLIEPISKEEIKLALESYRKLKDIGICPPIHAVVSEGLVCHAFNKKRIKGKNDIFGVGDVNGGELKSTTCFDKSAPSTMSPTEDTYDYLWFVDIHPDLSGIFDIYDVTDIPFTIDKSKGRSGCKVPFPRLIKEHNIRPFGQNINIFK